MAYNGSGTFVPLTAPTYPAVDGQVIFATYYNLVIADLISGLNKAMCRDGQSTATANLPMGGFTLSGLRAAVANGEAVEYSQFAAALANLVITTSANLPANTTIGAVTPAEIAALDNVSGNIETTFAKIASPALTGVPTAPTASAGVSSMQIANMAAVVAQAFLSALPGQNAGTIGKVVLSDGANAYWGDAGSVGSDLFLYNNF